MMRCLTTGIVLLSYVLLYGQEALLNPAHCVDSLIIQIDNESTLYVQWRLGGKTSLSTISAETGLGHDLLLDLNPILRFRDLAPCDIILTPLKPGVIDAVYVQDARPVYYKVREQETVFGIARRMLQIPVHRLLEMNNMHDDNLRNGQTLLVGWLGKNPPDDPDEAHVSTMEWSPGSGYLLDTHTINASPGKKYTRQKGVAWWNKMRPDSNFFALHRSAPINSLIEIHNPMFRRTVWAKVIGTIPPTYAEDISVIVSQGVAKYLGAIDGRFYVEMSYELK